MLRDKLHIFLLSVFPYLKWIQDSLGFWIAYCRFRISGTGFQSLSLEIGFWIPIAIVSGIPDSLSCIPDSKTQYPGFHRQKFPGFWNPHSLTWDETLDDYSCFLGDRSFRQWVVSLTSRSLTSYVVPLRSETSTAPVGWLLLVLSFAPRGFSRILRFSPLLKTNISKFQFDQESGRQRTTWWMCYLQIIIYLFIYLLFIYMLRSLSPNQVIAVRELTQHIREKTSEVREQDVGETTRRRNYRKPSSLSTSLIHFSADKDSSAFVKCLRWSFGTRRTICYST